MAIVEKPYQEVYIVAKRTIAGSTVYTIERQDFTAIDDPKESQDGQLCNLDCSTCFNYGFPVGLVQVPHLANQTVSIVGDGAVQPDREADADGFVVIDPPASVIDVGINYTSTLKTVRPEIPQGPTIQGARQRWIKIFVRVLQSVGLYVNDQQVPFRKPSDPMGGPVTPQTDDINVENLGYDRNGQITIEQRQPLPSTVLAVFGEIDINMP